MNVSLYRWGVIMVIHGCALFGVNHVFANEEQQQSTRQQPILNQPVIEIAQPLHYVRFDPLTGTPIYLSRRMVSVYCAQQGNLRRLECQRLFHYLYSVRS